MEWSSKGALATIIHNTEVITDNGVMTVCSIRPGESRLARKNYFYRWIEHFGRRENYFCYGKDFLIEGKIVFMRQSILSVIEKIIFATEKIFLLEEKITSVTEIIFFGVGSIDQMT